MFKKADLILAMLLIVLGIGVSVFAVFGQSTGKTAEVFVDGRLYGEYSLDKNQTITINNHDHHNEITIKDGKVSMSFSDCKNQVCVDTGSIAKTSQTIACLPNRVLIKINGDEEVELDAVSN